MQIAFDQAKLRDVFAPAVRQESRVDSPDWQAELARIARKRAKETLRKRIRRWLTARSSIEIYEDLWSPDLALNRLNLAHGPAHAVVWGEDCYWAHVQGIKRVHLHCLASIIEQLKPSSVLEVGCGTGQNLSIMASAFPDVRFTGIEPTTAGYETAKHICALDSLPEAYASFSPAPVRDRWAFKRVELIRGGAQELPFDTGSFDLVFTMQAVEQMWTIRRNALPEIARVGRGPLAMFEPFADFNATPSRRERIRRHGLFRETISALPRYGIQPVKIEDNLPTKLDYGVGLVLSSTA